MTFYYFIQNTKNISPKNLLYDNYIVTWKNQSTIYSAKSDQGIIDKFDKFLPSKFSSDSCLHVRLIQLVKIMYACQIFPSSKFCTIWYLICYNCLETNIHGQNWYIRGNVEIFFHKNHYYVVFLSMKYAFFSCRLYIKFVRNSGVLIYETLTFHTLHIFPYKFHNTFMEKIHPWNLHGRIS